MINIDRERYLQHTVTDLETPNEPLSIEFPVLGNYSCDSDFGNFIPHLFVIPPTQKSEMTFQFDLLAAAEEIILCQYSSIGVIDNEDESEKISRHEEVINFPPQIWTLYFDGSKSQEGSRAGCILIHPKGKQTFYPVDWNSNALITLLNMKL